MPQPLRAAFLSLLFFSAGMVAHSQNVQAPAGTPKELLEAGNAAYVSGQWAESAQIFQTFLDTYGKDSVFAETVQQVKPLLTLARIRLSEFGAAGELISECLTFPRLQPKLRDELSFWKGIILLKVEAYTESRAAFLAYYQTPEFDSLRKVETLLLYGTTYILENKHAEAATFFEQQSKRLWDLNQEAAMRAQVLRFHCLLQTEDLDKALELVRMLQPLMDKVTQIVSLHGLMAELGGRYLEKQDYYHAIYCLQRVWPAERLVRHQEARIEHLKLEIEALLQRPNTEPLVFQKRSVLTRAEREYNNFSSNDKFDQGVRMRLGFAWLGLERYREAALVLEDALNLPGEAKQQTQAGLIVVQCWLELTRYDRCVASADAWLIRFAKTADEDSVARVRFMMAQALHDDEKFQEATPIFEEVAKSHSKHELAPQALFMAGICHMMSDDHPGAIQFFQQVEQNHASLPIAETADYWHGMALSFHQEYEACRSHLAAHLQHYGPNARYLTEANFRRAYCLFALGAYEDSIQELRSFVQKFPQTQDAGEAKVLIGDALCSLGEIEPGLESYRSVVQGTRYWHDEAQFKIGNVLKLRKDWDGLRSHFTAFITENPDSKRLAEAVYWAGFASLSQDRLEEARQLYWQTITQLGNMPDRYGVEDILIALPRLYRGEEGRIELLREVQRVRTKALKDKQTALACRMHWMEGHAEPADKPRMAQADFIMAADLLNVEKQNPRIIADCADASAVAGNKTRAKDLYIGLIKWHPRAVEVERAYAGLGQLSAEAGAWEEALGYFEQFEKRVVSVTLRPQVLMKKAELLTEHAKEAEAIGIYKGLLEDKLTPSRSRAEALLAWGKLWEKQGETLKAAALYERVYLSYGRNRDLMAQAYLARGMALEKLNKKAEAAEVYQELIKTEVLQSQPEFSQGADRLAKLGPVLEAKLELPKEEVKP